MNTTGISDDQVHPPYGVLDDFVRGGEKDKEVLDRLARCATCKRRLERLREVSAGDASAAESAFAALLLTADEVFKTVGIGEVE